eukprot:COSAG02_NODE_137_length_34526_cov_94.448079_6_plen_140_part_00
MLRVTGYSGNGTNPSSCSSVTRQQAQDGVSEELLQYHRDAKLGVCTQRLTYEFHLGAADAHGIQQKVALVERDGLGIAPLSVDELVGINQLVGLSTKKQTSRLASLLFAWVCVWGRGGSGRSGRRRGARLVGDAAGQTI